MIANNLKYETFTEFCNRAVELRKNYAISTETPSFLLKQYRDYVYSHDFGKKSIMINGKCWEWLLSLVYEPMKLNDLYSLLGKMKKGS